MSVSIRQIVPRKQIVSKVQAECHVLQDLCKTFHPASLAQRQTGRAEHCTLNITTSAKHCRNQISRLTSLQIHNKINLNDNAFLSIVRIKSYGVSIMALRHWQQL